MILFVFEGEKREPELFRAIEKLFFKDSQHIVCSFENNIYELYQRLKNLDDSGDIVSVLREKYDGRTDSGSGGKPCVLRIDFLQSKKKVFHVRYASQLGSVVFYFGIERFGRGIG